MEMSSSVKYAYNLPPDMSFLDKWLKPETHYLFKDIVKWVGDFTWKDDDVTICTFPRSGTHLYWNVVRMIVHKEAKIPDDAFLDSHITGYLYQDNIRQGRRVFSAHSLPYDIADDFILNGQRKFIYVMRNPKDVLASYSELIPDFESCLLKTLCWEDFVDAFVSNDVLPSGRSWFDHVRAWAEYTDAHPEAPILRVSFEDFQKDREGAIRKLAKFLEVDLSENMVEAIAEQSLFKNMKNTPLSDKVKLVTPDIKPKYYRKGLVGDWKNYFTVAQNEIFDREIEKRMNEFKWDITYQL